MKKTLRKKKFETSSHISIKDLYTEKDLSPNSLQELGVPGAFPFTRGIQSTMYRNRLWTMRQYAGFSTAQESNRRYRLLLDKGTTGIKRSL